MNKSRPEFPGRDSWCLYGKLSLILRWLRWRGSAPKASPGGKLSSDSETEEERGRKRWIRYAETDLERRKLSACLCLYRNSGYLPSSSSAPFGGTFPRGEGLCFAYKRSFTIIFSLHKNKPSTFSTPFSTELFHILHKFVHKVFGEKCGKIKGFFELTGKNSTAHHKAVEKFRLTENTDQYCSRAEKIRSDFSLVLRWASRFRQPSSVNSQLKVSS